MTERKLKITINSGDGIMLMVAIEERLKTWQRTAEYWRRVELVGEWEARVDGDIEVSNSRHEADAMGSAMGRIYS